MRKNPDRGDRQGFFCPAFRREGRDALDESIDNDKTKNNFILAW